MLKTSTTHFFYRSGSLRDRFGCHLHSTADGNVSLRKKKCTWISNGESRGTWEATEGQTQSRRDLVNKKKKRGDKEKQ